MSPIDTDMHDSMQMSDEGTEGADTGGDEPSPDTATHSRPPRAADSVCPSPPAPPNAGPHGAAEASGDVDKEIIHHQDHPSVDGDLVQWEDMGNEAESDEEIVKANVEIHEIHVVDDDDSHSNDDDTLSSVSADSDGQLEVRGHRKAKSQNVNPKPAPNWQGGAKQMKAKAKEARRLAACAHTASKEGKGYGPRPTHPCPLPH